MTTLITGGASQTGVALAKLLQASGHPVLFASRSGRVPEGFDSVKFDFTDPSTLEAPFSVSGHKIEYVYLLLPLLDLSAAKPFIDLAVTKGTKRFVLLSASGKYKDKGPGSDGTGTENLLRIYGVGIKQHNVIQNTLATARIPLIAVDDIAQAAFDAITDVGKLPNREPILIGPDLVSYSEIAEAFSQTLGRSITFSVISREEVLKRYLSYGVPDALAHYLVNREDEEESNGESAALLKDPRSLTGKLGVKEWIVKHKQDFIAA
ncbi:NmrA family protein [Ephemerocybe angulata]|uniref:NmrA family protein n=1 Tax=Ephemerocybe angulata TaxID=980116 RepID=A0A8H6IH20_9AGAR|nr:NmrA family protein [Tulosesus angulatus]